MRKMMATKCFNDFGHVSQMERDRKRAAGSKNFVARIYAIFTFLSSFIPEEYGKQTHNNIVKKMYVVFYVCWDLIFQLGQKMYSTEIVASKHKHPKQ